MGALLLAAPGNCTSYADFHWITGGPAGGQGGDGGAGGAGGAPPVCMPGEQRECYTGPAAAKGQGICKPGVETCNADGLAWGPCAGDVLPMPVDDCSTPVDEDCDGIAAPCDGSCVWSKSFGDASSQGATSIDVGPDGGLIIAGGFAGEVTFGGPTLFGNAGDLFLARFAGDGEHVWSQALSGPSSGFFPAATFDEGGNVCVAGAFQGSLDLGGGPQPGAGGWDVFVCKRATDGAPAWGMIGGDEEYQVISKIATDSEGNVVVAGELTGTMTLGGPPLTNPGQVDAFVVKLDAQGNHLWSSRFGDADTQVARALAIDAAGSIVIGGMFWGSIDFGGGVLTSAGAADIFVAKLGPDGAHLWSRSFGDTDLQTIDALAIDPLGNVVLTGSFVGKLDLGGGPLDAVAPTTLFTAKITGSSGTHLWSKTFGDASQNAPTRVAVGKNGTVIVAGGFSGTVDFGGGPLAALGEDVFVAKLDADGKHLWSKRFGDPDNALQKQQGNAIAVDAQGDLFLTGIFRGKIDFGCGLHTSAGDFDVFVARLSP